MARRTYSDDEKALGLASLTMHGGDVSKAARAAGVPRKTLEAWRDASEPTIRQIGQQKEAELAVMAKGIAERAAGLIALGFDYADDARDDDGQPITGAMAWDKLSDLNRVTGTMIDKWQLLTGGATARVEHDVVIDAGDDGRG